MINCNPETVSTDYDTSDRLYFEPLSPEEVLAVLDREQPEGVVTQFGGQTPLRLARHIEAAGYRIMGTPLAAIDLAEDRELFGALADELGIRCPPWATVEGADEALAAAAEIGYPVLVRPSYVLGGRAMRVCYDDAQLREAMAAVSGSVLVDRFVENAVEIDVDALCDGEDVFIAAVMQHVEEAGVHSGDSSCVLPAQSLTLANALEVEHIVKRLAPALGVVGLAQHPARDRRLDRVRPRGEPARLAHRPVRLEGDRDQPRRGRLQARRRAEAARSGAADAAAAAGQRQGRRAPVRPLPRRRPRARARDALDRRGDGERLRPADRVREGRARRRPAAAGLRARRSSRSTTPTSRASSRSQRRSRASASSSSRRTARRGRSAPQGSRWGRWPRSPTPTTDEQTVVDLIRDGRCDLIINTPAGLGGPRRRLPHPRGGARARACRASPRSRARRRPSTRSRTRAPRRRSRCRSGSGPARDGRGARRDGRELRVTGTEPIGPYTLLRVAAGPLEPGVPGQFFMLHPPGHVLPRPMSLCLAEAGELVLPDRPDRSGHADALQPRGRATRCTCSARSATASTSRCRGRCSSAAGSAMAPLPVRRAGARRAARDPRLPLGAPRRGGRARSRRRGRARADLRHVAASRRAGSTCSRAARSRCSRRSAASRRRPSSPGRRRWPAATAPATAASSRSTAACSGSASRGRFSGPRDRPAPQRQRLPRRAHRARRGARARRLRDEDDHARSRARATRRSGSPRPSPGCSTRSGSRGRASRHSWRTTLPALAELGLRVWVSVGGFSAADYAGICERLDERADVEVIELNLSCPNVEEAPESSAQIVAAAAPAPRSRSTRSSRRRPGTSPSRRGPSSRPERTGSRSSTRSAGWLSIRSRSGRSSPAASAATPVPRSSRSRSPACRRARERSTFPSSGMGGVRSGLDALELDRGGRKRCLAWHHSVCRSGGTGPRSATSSTTKPRRADTPIRSTLGRLPTVDTKNPCK